MKKLLLLLLSLIILPCSINAANGLDPFSKSMSYNAIVTNPNGAKVYEVIDESTEPDECDEVFEQIDTIPYNQKIKIIEEEYDLFSNDYNAFRINMNESIEELKKSTFASFESENNSGYIKIDDIELLEKTYTIKKEDFIDDEEELYTIKDLEIKKGPANSFESTGTIIKKGEIIKARDFLISSYSDSCEDFENEEENNNGLYKCVSYWKYIEYNNVKGYINSYDSLTYKDDNTYIFNRSIDLMYIEYKGIKKFIMSYEEDDYKEDKSYKLISSHTIPVNTIIKDNLLSNPTSRFYIVKIMNNDELIDIPSYQLASKKDKIKITALKDLKVYNESSQTDKKDRKAIATIKKDESFITNFYDIDDENTIFIYYEKNDIKGWIEIKDDDFEGFEYLDKKSNVGKISNKVSYCYIGKKNCNLPSDYKEQEGEVFKEIKLMEESSNTPNEQQNNNINNNETTINTKQINNKETLIKYAPILIGVILIIIIICILSKKKKIKKEETNQENS